MAYDPKVYELAEWFASDIDQPVWPKQSISKLAQGIQDYIEDFLSDLEYDRIQELEAARDKAAEDKMDERRINGIR